MVLWDVFYYYSLYIDEKTETQIGEVTCLKSYSKSHFRYDSGVPNLYPGLWNTVPEKGWGSEGQRETERERGQRAKGRKRRDSQLVISIFWMSKWVQKFNNYTPMITKEMIFYVSCIQFQTIILAVFFFFFVCFLKMSVCFLFAA